MDLTYLHDERIGLCGVVVDMFIILKSQMRLVIGDGGKMCLADVFGSRLACVVLPVFVGIYRD